jgi:hypothetical protein
MMKKKWDMGLPLGQPTMFKDVPVDSRKAFEEAYSEEARATGQRFLEIGKIPDAWLYYRILGDQQPVYAALEKLPIPKEADDEVEELIRLAIYQKVHPVKGLQVMLAVNGMCNTVTACDQVFHDLSLVERQGITKILVNEMYTELVQILTREIRKQVPLLPPGKLTLEELITGREWLFEDDNYHVDVSHLNAVVRFSRCLTKDDTELELTRQLAIYGSKLARTLQYAGEIPFVDFYAAHLAYFKVVMQQNADIGFAYFEQQLKDEPDQIDQQLIGFVLVDLYVRTGNIIQATHIAKLHLTNITQDAGFSFRAFCLEHQQFSALKDYAKEIQDHFLYVTALLEEARHKA